MRTSPRDEYCYKCLQQFRRQEGETHRDDCVELKAHRCVYESASFHSENADKSNVSESIPNVCADPTSPCVENARGGALTIAAAWRNDDPRNQMIAIDSCSELQKHQKRSAPRHELARVFLDYVCGLARKMADRFASKFKRCAMTGTIRSCSLSISDEDYAHVRSTWDRCDRETIRAYRNVFANDACQLDEFFKEFRNLCMATHRLDATAHHYYSSPGLSFDAGSADVDLFDAAHDEHSQFGHRRANRDDEQLSYLDTNNLYGSIAMELLPRRTRFSPSLLRAASRFPVVQLETMADDP